MWDLLQDLAEGRTLLTSMAFKTPVTSLISYSTNGRDRWPESWIHVTRFGPIDTRRQADVYCALRSAPPNAT